MPREQAERVFSGATCKERFKQESLYSYYFYEGWIEFVLIFDDDSRLRRLYLLHQYLEKNQELPLFRDNS